MRTPGCSVVIFEPCVDQILCLSNTNLCCGREIKLLKLSIGGVSILQVLEVKVLAVDFYFECVHSRNEPLTSMRSCWVCNALYLVFEGVHVLDVVLWFDFELLHHHGSIFVRCTFRYEEFFHDAVSFLCAITIHLLRDQLFDFAAKFPLIEHRPFSWDREVLGWPRLRSVLDGALEGCG